MPFLDVSDVLTDPDFADSSLICERNSNTTDDTGHGVVTTELFAFSGVVTSDRGKGLQRGAVAEHGNETIWVITRFKLVDQDTGLTADIVRWNGKRYTVKNTNDYSTYGVGFIQGICELIPLAG